MNAWTTRAGYPVVVARRTHGGLLLQQQRLVFDEGAQSDDTVWDIPIRARNAQGEIRCFSLSSSEAMVPLPESKWWKLNTGQSGFFVVHYNAATWESLAEAVSSGSLPESDRFGLSTDAYLLMRAGYLPVERYLRFVDCFAHDPSEHVWTGLSVYLQSLVGLFAGHAQLGRLTAKARKVVTPLAHELGVHGHHDESEGRSMLRESLVSAAFACRDPRVTRSLFQSFCAGSDAANALAANLRPLACKAAARIGGDQLVDQLMQLAETATSEEARANALGALGYAASAKAVGKALSYGLSDALQPQDLITVLYGFCEENRPLAWSLLKRNWHTVAKKFGDSPELGLVIQAMARGMREEAIQDMEHFFTRHPSPAATETLAQCAEAARTRARFVSRNAEALATPLD